MPERFGELFGEGGERRKMGGGRGGKKGGGLGRWEDKVELPRKLGGVQAGLWLVERGGYGDPCVCVCVSCLGCVQEIDFAGACGFQAAKIMDQSGWRLRAPVAGENGGAEGGYVVYRCPIAVGLNAEIYQEELMKLSCPDCRSPAIKLSFCSLTTLAIGGFF